MSLKDDDYFPVLVLVTVLIALGLGMVVLQAYVYSHVGIVP